jgi:hypothetical protein
VQLIMSCTKFLILSTLSHGLFRVPPCLSSRIVLNGILSLAPDNKKKEYLNGKPFLETRALPPTL